MCLPDIYGVDSGLEAVCLMPTCVCHVLGKRPKIVVNPLEIVSDERMPKEPVKVDLKAGLKAGMKHLQPM